MKVILYMTMTVNGYIARKNDDTPWSVEVWNDYYSFVKKRGNLILGKRTYEIMKEVDEFKELDYPFTVVVSNSKRIEENEKTVFVSSPQEAVEILRQKKFNEIIVGGGGTLNASFLKSNLLDEIYLDIDPVIWGGGIKLFSDVKAETKLELLEIIHVSKNTIRLHYKILK